MRSRKMFFTLALFFIAMSFGIAQSVIDRGYIKLEVTDVYSENEQMQAMSGMLKGSYTDIYFSPERSFTRANMMGGMSETMVLTSENKQENLMLMSVMGQKMMVKLSEEELKEMQGAAGDQPQVNYKHFEDETKEILGFTCHKVEMEMDNNQAMGMGMGMTLWVTKEISAAAHVSNGIQVEQLGGFPLEYKMSLGGQMDMTMTAVTFEKEIDDSVFKVDTSGYKEMTMDELMNSMGAGMGGF